MGPLSFLVSEDWQRKAELRRIKRLTERKVQNYYARKGVEYGTQHGEIGTCTQMARRVGLSRF